tara:strand:+ start:669 stop:878 length:210 start_codon:yes stop_codon:yes gene_type:complete
LSSVDGGVGSGSAELQEHFMTLPKIDLASLAELEGAAGVFGSLGTAASDDTIVAIMVYVHDMIQVELLF